MEPFQRDRFDSDDPEWQTRVRQLRREVREATEPEAIARAKGRLAHQHCGKCLVERGDHERVRRHLERALEIRREQDDAELVASTEAAIEGLEGRRGAIDRPGRRHSSSRTRSQELSSPSSQARR